MPEIGPGMTVIVMGLGRFGGGVGAASYLLARGASVTVTDLAEADSLQDSITTLRQVKSTGTLEFELGTHENVSFEDAALVVVSPAVPRPWENKYLKRARDAGVPVCTEIELFLERVDHRKLIAVTGSAGKSSTCAMIHHLLLESDRRCLLGGNLGGSLLGSSQEVLDDADAIVLELSSFMLHWIKTSASRFQPQVGVLTSLSQNHIDWHQTVEHYVAAKRFLLESVVAGNLVLPSAPEAVDSELKNHLEPVKEWMARSDKSWDEANDRVCLQNSIRLHIPGAHQKENASVALMAVACFTEVLPEARRQTARSLAPMIESFSGLPHRLKPLPGFETIMVVDDSKSTTPEATMKAVEAFGSASSIHLIAGGFDKRSDLGAVDRLGDRLAGLYAIGATSDQLLSGANARSCNTVEEAVRCASQEIREGEILLLSPGCASWDQFENYEQRGRAFETAARAHLMGR